MSEAVNMKELCECGCARNWHSLAGDECLYCMKCPRFAPVSPVANSHSFSHTSKVKPEQKTQQAIMEWLAAKRIFAMRMQTGALNAMYKGKSRFMRFGLPGQADILAFYPCYDCNRGFIVIWIEVKSNIGRQSDLQKSFEQDVLERGHRYILARSVEDVENAFKER